MRSEQIADLIAYMRAQVNSSGADDLLYRWVEEALVIIREQPWSWNWSDHKGLTSAVHTTAHVFTWIVGDNYIVDQTGIIPATEYQYTGRRVKLGDEWYTVTDIGISNPNRIYLDRKINSSQSLPGIVITLYRTNDAVKTSGLDSVGCGRRAKLLKYDQNWFSRMFTNTRWDELEPSTPVGYLPRHGREYRIDSPRYAPALSSSGAFALANGTYYYFFTRRCQETSLESKPGPVTKWENTDGFAPLVTYGNPAGDFSDFSSYDFILYRSLINPNLTRCPMFEIMLRGPELPGSSWADLNPDSVVCRAPQFYDGPYTVIELLPPPSDERLNIDVHHIANWSHRPYDEEFVDMGTENSVIELLRIYLLGLMRLSGSDAKEYRTAAAAFRSQMRYLATKTRSPGKHDTGADEYLNYREDVTAGKSSGMWVDGLPWSSDW